MRGLGEPWVQKKPSGEEAARLTIFFWGRGGGCAGPLGDTSSVEPDGKGTGAKSFFPLMVGEWVASHDGPPSLQVLESEARLSVEPVVKLTWAPRKDGLRLSAELWLTFSKSELLLFIFNRCHLSLQPEMLSSSGWPGETGDRPASDFRLHGAPEVVQSAFLTLL